MLKVEIERLSGGWLVTVERNGKQITRRFTLESQLAKDIAWTALETEIDG